MKASDISDDAVYAVLAASERGCAYIWDIRRALIQFPSKVVSAKCKQMVTSGRMRGCPCGCRGDFRFPWQEFGAPADVANWQERITEYLNGEKRIYGH